MKKRLPLILLLVAVFAIGVRVGGNQQSKKIAPTSTPQTRSIAAATIAPVRSPVQKQTSSKQEYIGNKKSKKFHKPSCSSVKQMNESNKVYFDCTREEVIAKGYDPCGRCHP